MTARRTVLPPSSPDWAVDLVNQINDMDRRIRLLKQYGGDINEYSVSDLPDVTGNEKRIFVTDETGGYTLAFTDGTNWRRVQDRAIVS
jgi:hypothetical protein